MTLGHLKREYQKLMVLVLVGMLPFVANSTTEEGLDEKRIRVAMRMIGHDVLSCMGDVESRVMPIEKIDEHYKISFESEFGIEPSDVVSIVDRVMTEAKIASYYLVEVEHCETKDVVHSFEGGSILDAYLTPCRGRMLPEACYNLLITILEDARPIKNLLIATDDNSSPTFEEASASSSPSIRNFASVKLSISIISLFFLVGVIGYFIRKKNSSEVDPNLIWIGAFRFNKRNMVLSFEDKNVELSNKEAELLSLLHSAVNVPLEREVILQKVWGDEGDYVGRTLDVFISKLRKRLEADTSVKIVNIRGIGYKLVIDGGR